MASPPSLPLVVLALCAVAVGVCGQEDVDRVVPFLRAHHSDAPVPLRLHLRARPQPVVGSLRCRIVQAEATLVALEMPDHYLGDRPSTVTLVLPPFAEYWDPQKPVSVIVNFDAGTGPIEVLAQGGLGVLDFRARDPSSTAPWPLDLTVVGLRTPFARSDAEGLRLLLSLVEMPAEDEPGRRLTLRKASVQLLPHLDLVDPEELPTLPAAYGAIDLLVLAGPGVAILRTDQLRAVERWVRTGGALCVVAHPDYAGRPIAELLARLAEAAHPDPGMPVTPNELAIVSKVDERLWNVDLGRVAYLRDAAELAEIPGLDFLILGRRPILGEGSRPHSPDRDPTVDAGIDRADLLQLARGMASPTRRSDSSIAAQVGLVAAFLTLAAGLCGVWLRRAHRRLVWPTLFALSLLTTLGAGAVASWSYAELARSRRVAFEVVSSEGTLLRRWELDVEFPTAAEVREDPVSGPVTVLDLYRPQGAPVVTPEVGAILIGSPSIVESVRLERRPWTPISVHRGSAAMNAPATGVDWDAVLAAQILPILNYELVEKRLADELARIRTALPPQTVLVAVTYRETLQIEPWSSPLLGAVTPRAEPGVDLETVRLLARHVRRLRQPPRGGPPPPRTAASTMVTPDFREVALLAVWTDASGVVAQCRLTRLRRRAAPGAER